MAAVSETFSHFAFKLFGVAYEREALAVPYTLVK